ncbi:GNAT family N-acetyltransferase [Bacillus sp. FJAT-52991]|uniref:GNAT family N-acetyltransferase n=1 Tax=Bacillus kandeliae TaxID=3129297 RepID=A0ABZ2NAB8_9BACI
MLKISKERNPIWDERKEEIFNQADVGTFNIADNVKGNRLFGEWWSASINETICGYIWGQQDGKAFEVSFIVDAAYRNQKIGEALLREVELSVKCHGVEKIIAIVQPENPNIEKMIEWLYKLGYHLEFNGLKSEKFARNLSKKGIIPLELVKILE